MSKITKKITEAEQVIKAQRRANEYPAVIISFAHLYDDIHTAPNLIDRPLTEWEIYKNCNGGPLVLDLLFEYALRKGLTKAHSSIRSVDFGDEEPNFDTKAVPEIPQSERIPNEIWNAWLNEQLKIIEERRKAG